MGLFRPRLNEADPGQGSESPRGRRGTERPLKLAELDIDFQAQIEQRRVGSFREFERLSEDPERPELERDDSRRPASPDTVEAVRKAIANLYHHACEHGEASGLLQQDYDDGKRGSIYMTPADPTGPPVALYDTHGRLVSDGQGEGLVGKSLGSVSYILEQPGYPKADSTWRVVEAPEGRTLQRAKQFEGGRQRIHYAAGEDEAGSLVAALRMQRTSGQDAHHGF